MEEREKIKRVVDELYYGSDHDGKFCRFRILPLYGCTFDDESGRLDFQRLHVGVEYSTEYSLLNYVSSYDREAVIKHLSDSIVTQMLEPMKEELSKRVAKDLTSFMEAQAKEFQSIKGT